MTEIIDLGQRIHSDDRALADETADCLRKWLEMAEAGEIVSVALVAEHRDQTTGYGHSIAAASVQVVGGLSILQGKLMEDLQ